MLVINKKPDSMSYEQYSVVREFSNYAIKQYLKGKQYHVSQTAVIAKDPAGNPHIIGLTPKKGITYINKELYPRVAIGHIPSTDRSHYLTTFKHHKNHIAWQWYLQDRKTIRQRKANKLAITLK